MKTHCKDCEWWEPSITDGGKAEVGKNEGECRRNPPVIIDDAGPSGWWPTTSENDWCGAGRERVKS